MRKVSIFILGAALIAAAVHVSAVWAVPRVIMSKVMGGITGHAEANRFVHAPLATSAARTVVRPSPDLAYSVCALDLSAGPVRVTVPVTEPYTSVALYSSTTDNYFARNDRQADGGTIDIVVTAPGAGRPGNVPAGTEIVEAPGMKGLVLVRRVVASREAFPPLDQVRQASVCAPLG